VLSDKTNDGRKTLLVVDDDQDLLDIVQNVVEDEGFRVLTAADGEAAFRLLEAENPCLILLDLKMPGMDGQEFRRRQLTHPRLAAIPVVGFSGVSNGEIEAQRLALSSYLNKPVNLHHLLETVAHYCSDPDHIEGAGRSSAAIS
jgi:CheY-like chemotaxis protein